MSAGQGLPKTLGNLKRLIMVLLGAAIAAALLTGVLVFAGLVDLVPRTRLRSIDRTLEPWFGLFLVLFVTLAFVGTLYVFYAKKIVKNLGKARDQWSSLPPAAQAVLAGFPFAAVAAASAVATDVIAASMPMWVQLGLPVAVWVVVAAVGVRHVRAGEPLRELIGVLSTATLTGVGLGALVLLLDRIVDSVSIPGYLPLATLVVAAPVVAILLVRNAQRQQSYLSTILIRTGFAQVRRIQTMTVALGIGFLVGVLGALLVSVTLGGLVPTLVAFLVLLLVATYGALRWFQRTDIEYSDLVIVDVRDRSSGRRRELAVVNERDRRVDLRDAKIRDTAYDLYRTNIDVILAPGQTETFDIPPGFSLFPSTDNVATDLPLGLSLSKSADAPVIVTRSGEKFKLRWAEGVAEQAAHAARQHQQAPSPEADRGRTGHE